MEIEVENVSSDKLTDVSVTRSIPGEFVENKNSKEEASEDASDVSTENESTDSSEDYAIKRKKLTWNVGELEVGEKRVLKLDMSLNVNNSKPVKAGIAKATYKANATLSSMQFEQLDAYCRGFSYMAVDEDERPDNWKCVAVFENRSSFVVDLVKLHVKMTGSDDLLFDINDVPDDVSPGGRWSSDVEIVEANDRPDFTNELGYTVLPRCVQTTEGSLELEQNSLEVLDAEMKKTYSSDVLRSYREQNVTSEIRLKNAGSATINLVRITDDIPGLFGNPDTSSIVVKINDDILESEQVRADVESGVSLESKRLSPDGEGYTMRIQVGNKAPIGLEPKQELVVTYNLTAPDPSPENKNVAAPANCEFISEKSGPVCMREVAKAPALRVSHKRRKFNAGKTLIPTGGTGNYEVMIMFENRSDTALKDIYLNDYLPEAFQLKEHRVEGEEKDNGKIKMKSKEVEGGLSIEWHIPVINKDQKLELYCVVKAEGEFKISDLQSFKGARFGDEVDEDLPPLPPEEEAPAEEAPAEEAAPSADYDSMKVAELKELLKAAGKPVSGKKADLIARLNE